MLQNISIFNTIFNDAPQPWQLGFQDSAAPGLTGMLIFDRLGRASCWRAGRAGSSGWVSLLRLGELDGKRSSESTTRVGPRRTRRAAGARTG